MALVSLRQPTDMNDIQTISHPVADITPTEIDFFGDNGYAYCQGDFQTATLEAQGTITDVLVDDSDFGVFPNCEITGLSFFLTESNFNNIISTGDLFDFVVQLLSGSDTINGSSGSDQLLGFDGDDTFVGGPGADVINGGNGIDTASYSTASAGLFAGIEDENANTGDAAGDTYISIENLVGSAFNDTLYGNGLANHLSGGGGDDTLVGKGGADVFDGGAGSDTVAYDASPVGIRADLLAPSTNTGDAAGDSYISIENLDGSSFNDILLGDNNANIIRGNLFPNLASGDDQLFGRGGNDSLFGNDGADKLDGGTGADLMVGGPGNDTYTVDNPGDVVDEGVAGSDGTDTVLSSITFSLSDTAHAKGSIENLTLTGTAAINGTGNNLANTIIGNSAANVITGLGGRDIMTGGAGADTFVFKALTDSVIGANRDQIRDFTHGSDHIDLSAIDANTQVAGNQVFTFIGNAPFSRHAGELQYAVVGANTIVSGDVNGDAKADFQILLVGHPALTQSDFIL